MKNALLLTSLFLVAACLGPSSDPTATGQLGGSLQLGDACTPGTVCGPGLACLQGSCQASTTPGAPSGHDDDDDADGGHDGHHGGDDADEADGGHGGHHGSDHDGHHDGGGDDDDDDEHEDCGEDHAGSGTACTTAADCLTGERCHHNRCEID